MSLRVRQMEKMYRLRGLIFAVSLPLLLISVVPLPMSRVPSEPNPMMPEEIPNAVVFDAGSSGSRVHVYCFDHNLRLMPIRPNPYIVEKKVSARSKSYAVVLDAGSSRSRVHVYCFDHNLKLMPIGNGLELFIQKKPGLSAYAANPKEAANSLESLLEAAEAAVPENLRKSTPLRVWATAGLRQLPGDSAYKILQEVKDFLTDKSSLEFKPEWVTVLDGAQEGSFQWVTINYLLGNVGSDYSDTVGIVDLGGDSVQMAYAVSDDDAKSAPKSPKGEDSYIKEFILKGKRYHLYVHSYLHYGLLAARAKILKVTGDGDSPCILKNFQGSYIYGGSTYKASATSTADFKQCHKVIINALNHDQACTHMKCTFGGIWNGGGGNGQKKLFVASFFFDRAAEASFIDSSAAVAKVKPEDFKKAAKKACGSSYENAGKEFPNVDQSQLPYLCMDLAYQYTLLTDGFDLSPTHEITLVKQVKYKNSLVEAAWPLGSAIELVS